MVVHSDYPNIKVHVTVNGTPLQEYDDDEEESDTLDTITKYIEAVSDAEFQIEYEITPPWPLHKTLFKFYVDRYYTSGTFISEYQYQGAITKRVEKGARSRKNGQVFLQKFQFAKLSIVETGTEIRNDHESLKKALKSIGEIRVKAFYVQNLRQVGVLRDMNTVCKELGSLPEKALKGKTLSHHAAFGSEQPIASRGVMDYDYVDCNKKPFLTFVFKYRSRDALKSLMVIPRSPSPVPLEDRDIATLTEAEMRELLQRQRERDSAARLVKPERVKRERSATLDYSHYNYDDEEVSFVCTKRVRLPGTIDKNGAEMIDLS